MYRLNMAANDSSQQSTLHAAYQSPKESHAFSHSLPVLVQGFSTKDKTQYLSALRSAVVNMQKDVNVFLTAKMEEDKEQMTTGEAKVDDSKEEENYGEEVAEDD